MSEEKNKAKETPHPFEDFIEELRNAAQLNNNPDYEARDAPAMALWACINFVQRVEPSASERLHLPLSRLYNALIDLDNGKKRTLFEPRNWPRREGPDLPEDPQATSEPKIGRPPDTGEVNLIRAVAVGLMEALSLDRERCSVADAQKRVVRELERRGIRFIAGRELSARRIRQWRDEMNKLPHDDLDQMQFVRRTVVGLTQKGFSDVQLLKHCIDEFLLKRINLPDYSPY